MNVLIACEFSGVVRKAFRERGHNAWSCDILSSMDEGQHIQGDILDALKLGAKWDLMIAHPPCTYLCNSGVRWLHTEEGRWDQMRRAARLFESLMDANVPRIAIENPVMHRYAKDEIGCGDPDFTIQPWQYGHGETKRTCFWTKGLPALTPTDVVEGREQRIHQMSPGPDRGKQRSITYEGIAEAMAEQWGTINTKVGHSQ